MTEQAKKLAALEAAIDAVLDGAEPEQSKRNFLRTMQSGLRLRFTLAGNTAIAEALPVWAAEFDKALQTGREIKTAPDIRPRALRGR